MSQISVLTARFLLLAFASAASAAPLEPPTGLEFRLIGPAVSGRMTRVAGLANNPNVYYASAAQGGLWKSTDAGKIWEPIFDEQSTQSIGSFAIAPSDDNVLYVGSGEANIRGNVALGYGIWKSDDAGQSFRQVLALKGQIGTIEVHPQDANIAFAAVLGSPFGASEARGVYRTVDAGKSWQKVSYVNADTGASDVSISVQNPRVVFAGFWQARRSPWGLSSGGPGSALRVSRDGGTEWAELGPDEGLPEKPWGKIGVAVAPSDGNRIYALVEAKKGGLFRSDDGGKSFSRINAHRVLRQRAWYYSTMRVDPTNADVIWFPQVGLVRSKDGGRTLAAVAGTGHGDHHDVWINPKQPNWIIEANDGGLGISRDGGVSWAHPHLPTAQFYNIDVDNRTPYHVGGTMQDWGTASGPAKVFRDSGVNLSDWRYGGGGEAGDFVFDPKAVGEIYAGEYGGYLSHFSESTGQTRVISSFPANPSGIHARQMPYRFQWTAPILSSALDGALYHGGNVLFKSTDKGASWQPISPDLTRNDKGKQGWSGGPITGDITTVEYYNTIFSIAQSGSGVLYAGSDDGLVHRSQDQGVSWEKITPKGLPEWATIEAIHVSSHDPARVYLVAHNYRLDDHRPYLFRSNDQGNTWQKLGQNLPSDLTLWSVRDDPSDANYLYLGTQHGVWYSSNSGAEFKELALNLPKVCVTDLETRHGDLIVGTRGRSIWVLENLAALRALPAVQSQKLAFLPAAAAARFASDFRWGDESDGVLEAASYGINGHYWLHDAVKLTTKSPAVLEIFDAQGQRVRRISSRVSKPQYAEDDPDEPSKAPEAALSADKGLNSFNWDLRADGAKPLRRSKLDAGDAETGPLVPPGRYTAKLRIGDHAAQTEFEVQADPRSQTSAEDIRRDYQFARALIAEIDRARALIESSRVLRLQLEAQSKAVTQLRTGITSAQRAEFRRVAEALKRRLNQIESKLHNPDAKVVYDVLAGRDGGAKLYHQLVPLYGWAQSADDAPTQSMLQRQAQLSNELARAESLYAQMKDKELAKYLHVLAPLGAMIVP